MRRILLVRFFIDNGSHFRSREDLVACFDHLPQFQWVPGFLDIGPIGMSLDLVLTFFTEFRNQVSVHACTVDSHVMYLLVSMLVIEYGRYY